MRVSRKLISFVFLLIFGLFAGTLQASTTWTTGAYSNNADMSHNLSISGASSLTVTVTGSTESSYDFVYIYDANGNQVKQLTGSINETFTVTGSSIRARLTSDYSVTRSGVTVTIASAGSSDSSSSGNSNTGGGNNNTTWTTGAYSNNADMSHNLSISGASSLTVAISGSTESNYDYFYIYDANGNQVKKLTGSINELFTVPGSSIRARLTSDYSVTRSGVTVTIASAGDSNTGAGSTVSNISESMVLTDEAEGDYAMYKVLEVNKPQLNYGVIDRWQLEFSVPNGFYIAEIIPIKSINEQWEKVGSSVVMLVANNTIEGFGLFSTIGDIADIFRQIQDIYDNGSVVRTISFEGGVESFSSTKMLLKIKSTSSLPVQNWDFSISGWYARVGETWSALPGSSPSTPPN